MRRKAETPASAGRLIQTTFRTKNDATSHTTIESRKIDVFCALTFTQTNKHQRTAARLSSTAHMNIEHKNIYVHKCAGCELNQVRTTSPCSLYMLNGKYDFIVSVKLRMSTCIYKCVWANKSITAMPTINLCVVSVLCFGSHNKYCVCVLMN